MSKPMLGKLIKAPQSFRAVVSKLSITTTHTQYKPAYLLITYECRPESKDRLAIKKNKQNKNKKFIMYHYYRP
jgi:hypothetical protein